MSNDRDDRTEDALRRALSAEAGQVSPGGDGLMRIQERVANRDARMRWLRPALAGGVALVVVAAGVGSYAVVKHNSGNQTVTYANSHSPKPNDVSADTIPSAAIFPFTTAADEQAWEQEYVDGHSPWISDPTAVTESWLKYYLKESGHFEYSTQTPTTTTSVVQVTRSTAGGREGVTDVSLVKYDHAWLVTGAVTPDQGLAFTTPAAGEAVTSPVTVSGLGFGVDEQATVQIRNATTPDLLGQASTGPFGNGSAHWTASVPFTAISDAGVVVVTIASAQDGGLGSLAAEKVTFGSASHAVAGGSSKLFGVQNGHVTRFDAATGASEGPVNGSDGAGTAFEVRQFGNTLYFTAKTSDCLYLYSMPISGGSPTKVTTADPDYGIVGFDLSADGTKLAYAESSGCNQSKAGMGKLVFTDLSNGTTRKIDFPSEPPAIFGDPVWESDGIHVDAFVRTGMEGYLARYDSTSGSSPTPNANACSGFDTNSGLPNALAMGPGGVLWFAVQTGNSMQVLSCADNQPTVEFTVNGNDTPQSLSVNARGDALLVGTSDKVWKWTGTGNPTQLQDAAGVSSVAW